MTGAMLWAHDPPYPPNIDDIPVGTIVVYITRNGYYGKFIVTSRDYSATHNLGFIYTTFDSFGNILQTSGSTPVIIGPGWDMDFEATPANVQIYPGGDLNWWPNTGGMELYCIGNGTAARMALY